MGHYQSYTVKCHHATSHNVDIHKRYYRLTPLMAWKKNAYEIDDEKLYFHLKQYILGMSSHEYIYIWRYYHL